MKSYRFKNAIDPSQKNIPINQDYSLSGGKQFRIHGNPLSFFIVASHHKNFSYYDEEVRNTITSGDLSQDMNGEISRIETSQLAMAT